MYGNRVAPRLQVVGQDEHAADADGQDRRAETREQVTLPVSLADGRTALTRNISVSGLYFEAEGRWEMNKTIDLAIDMARSGGTIRFRGLAEIVRIEAGGARMGGAVRVPEWRVERVG